MAMALELPYPLCFLLLLLLLPYSITAQTYQNRSLGSSLTAGDYDSYWASSSGDFAFGFQQIANGGGYLLAIWFNKIPEKTIIWSANGDNLVPKGSKVQLSGGGIVLNDPTGKPVWNPVSTRVLAYAAMLDSGNFVLANQDSANLWESFNYPTDTILPTQTLDLQRMLVARYSETNYSNGRFQFSFQSDGNLGLYTRAFPRDSTNYAYWSSNTVGSGIQVIFNQSGSIYLSANNGTILNTIILNAYSSLDVYQRAILEYDGVFRHYVYPKSSSSSAKSWSMSQPIPSNICWAITTDIGGGACGFNSYCSVGDDARPKCECPDGYTFIDPNDVMKGCKQDFDSQSCDEASPETDSFDFKVMQNINWPLSDYEHFPGVTEDWCRRNCLGDCFCAVAIFGGTACWKKRLPLSNGRVESGAKALVKIRIDNSTLAHGGVADSKKTKVLSTPMLIVSVLLSSSVFLNFVLLLVVLLVVFHFKGKAKVLQLYPAMPGMNLRSFTYEELTKATNGFNEELGSGACATVYKGVLESDERSIVAVKKLNKRVKEGDLEFKAEVSAIGKTNHRNLVQLLGFCNEGQHRLLVYEFMSNGSLSSFLFGVSRANWYERCQVALGTARGLFYLHEECSTQIIHCDIKPQNILLDDSFTARISDFGLAKLLRLDQSRTTTGIRGTKGYVAPEWFRSMPITVKVDVYSFGILLLELICCRKNFEVEAEDEILMVLADWVYDCYTERKVDLLVKDDVEATDDIKRVEKYVMIAIWCIHEDPSLRPTMKKVIQMMEGVIEVSVPPNPSSFISSI